MPKHLSLYALLGLVTLVGVLFYHVIEPFLVALFIAVVLTVLFEPLFDYLNRWLGGRKRIAAALSTVCVVLLLVLPVAGVLLMASSQLVDTAKHAVSWLERWDGDDLKGTLSNFNDYPLIHRLERAYDRLSRAQQSQVKQAVASVSDGVVEEVSLNTRSMVGDLFDAAVSFAIMTLGLYYFLADGREFRSDLHRLLPLKYVEERQLFDQFQQVCRGVVLGTIAAGLAQSALAGIAYAVLGVDQVWLLVVLTMFCSFIPFVGSVAVWAPVAVTLYLNGQVASAMSLCIFGVLVISTVDNLIRAYVIGGEAKLHPLVALVSVMGALKLIGLWGIFIGPMVAAFFYALAQILRNRVLATLHEGHDHQGHQDRHD